MRSRTISILSALITISMLSVIGVQWYWVSESIDEKLQLFDSNAKEALNSSIDEIERRNNELLSREVDPWKNISGMLGTTIAQMGVEEGGKRQSNIGIVDTLIELGPSTANGQRAKVGVVYSRSYEEPNANGGIDVDNTEYLAKVLERVNAFNEENKYADTLIVSKEEIEEIIHFELLQNSISSDFYYKIVERKSKDVYADYSNSSSAEEMGYMATLLDPRIDSGLMLSMGFPCRGWYIMKQMGASLGWIALSFLLMVGSLTFTMKYMIGQKKLSEMKSDFINSMTHEFRTPLATIGMAAHNLKHPSISDKTPAVQEFADLITHESTRLNEHVENILQLAKLERGEMELKLSWASVNEIIESVIRSHKLYLESKNVSLKLNLDNSIGKVKIDVYHMFNVISNLLDNALKYSDSKPDVEIRTRSHDRFCEIVVADRGIGMTKREVEMAFKSFYRGRIEKSGQVKGFGVGLSYVDRVMKLQNGKVSLESQVGKGTKVILQIPIVT